MSKKQSILFSAPMVRALLDDSKTQTRRVVKPQPVYGHVGGMFSSWKFKKPGKNSDYFLYPNGREEVLAMCPYGQPGDRLWVRETWLKTNPWGDHHTYGYRASDEAEFPDAIWKPSIYMPRIASRITLEVTGVRVERLQDISEADAIAEGCVTEEVVSGYDSSTIRVPSEIPLPGGCGSEGWECARDWYADLWESINGPGSWDVNPWVWVIEFRSVK